MRKTTSVSDFFKFIGLTFLFSWAFWIPAALMGKNISSFPTILFYILGGFGPSAAGILFTYIDNEAPERRDFWRRATSLRRVGFERTAAILLLTPILTVGAILISAFTTRGLPEFTNLTQIFKEPLNLIPLFVIGIVAGPLSEELGWRGYALDALQRRFTPLTSSWILGIFWWAWHLPLFWIIGTSQNSWGAGSIMFWVFLLNILPLSLLMTWFYNDSNRSILAAILLHFGYNFTFSLFYPLPEAVEILRTLLLFLLATAITIFGQSQKPILSQS